MPTLAADVGGVSAMVEAEVNGMLFPRDASPGAYADWIASLWRRPDDYVQLRRRSAEHHQTRLNWDAWATALEHSWQTGMAQTKRSR